VKALHEEALDVDTTIGTRHESRPIDEAQAS
jgi:hypothetical protein